jgi:hypothetical protein
MGCGCRALWRVKRASILQRPAVLLPEVFRRYCLGCELRMGIHRNRQTRRMARYQAYWASRVASPLARMGQTAGPCGGVEPRQKAVMIYDQETALEGGVFREGRTKSREGLGRKIPLLKAIVTRHRSDRSSTIEPMHWPIYPLRISR